MSNKNFFSKEGDEEFTPITFNDRVDEARSEIIEEREKEDKSSVDLWVSEFGFVSPFPDRVIRKDVPDSIEVLKKMVEFLEEPIPGMVFATEEDELELIWSLARSFDLELGYIPNPDKEYKSWSAITDQLKQIDPLDIDAYFEPIHLPKQEEEVPDETIDRQGNNILDEDMNQEDVIED